MEPPRLDFLQQEGGRDADFYEALSETSQLSHNIRRVKVNEAREDTDSEDQDLNDLIDFFQESVDEKSDQEEINPFMALFPTKEIAQSYKDSHKCPVIEESSENKEKLQAYINRIRRVRVGRVNRKRSSPMMMGRIMGKWGNKKEVFIADTGTSVIILPINIARRNGVTWEAVDPDEPSYVGVTGVDLDIVGQASICAVFDNIKGGHNMQVLVARQEAQEILIDLDTLIDLSIVPHDFPLPQDPSMRSERCRQVREDTPHQIKEFTEVGPKLVSIQERQGSIRTALKFNPVDEDNIDEDMEIEKLRKKLLKKYSSVFKRDLDKDDRVDADPVKIDLVDSSANMGNSMIAIETPRHLQEAADEELSRLLKAGVLEPVHHATSTCSRAFFVQKNNKDGAIKARLVTDLKKVNPNLVRVGTPLDGSSHILKRLEPEETMFASVDMSSGYHQIAIDESSRDIFTVILPAGKFRYCTLPQGASVS